MKETLDAILGVRVSWRTRKRLAALASRFRPELKETALARAILLDALERAERDPEKLFRTKGRL